MFSKGMSRCRMVGKNDHKMEAGVQDNWRNVRFNMFGRTANAQGGVAQEEKSIAANQPRHNRTRQRERRRSWSTRSSLHQLFRMILFLMVAVILTPSLMQKCCMDQHLKNSVCKWNRKREK